MGTAVTETVNAWLDAEVFISQVREIADDDRTVWEHEVDPTVMAQIMASVPEGEKPMFVEVDVLYVGQSRKFAGSSELPNIGYSESTVKDTARLLPGQMAYLGHQKPQDEEYEYRHPTGRYVASRIVTKEVAEVGRVPVCVGKCFISSTAKDFRAHLREGLAGAVSIHGVAAFKTERGRRTNQTVGMGRLKSVDFCNPGTGGMKAAGVTAVVTEMTGEGPREPEGEPKMSDKPAITSVAALQREYPDLCKMLVATETQSFERTISEMTEEKGRHETRISELEGEAKEQSERADTAEAAHKEAKERAETAEKTVREQAAAVALAKVTKALDGKIDERIVAAKEGENAKHEVAVLEMARKRHEVTADVLAESDDENHTLSLAAAEKAFDATVGSVREMAKEMGVTLTPEKDVKETARGGTTSTANRDRDDTEKKRRDLLPAYARQQDGWKKDDK